MTVSRMSLPTNFYDVTSDLMLTAPEPQYLYAVMWMRAMAADLNVGGSFGLPGREVGGQGADYPGIEEGRLKLAPDVMSETIGARFEMNGMPGHTVRVNRPRFANTTYTKTSRQIVQNQTISTVPIAVGEEQVTLTLKKYAGPFDQANGRVAPYGLDAFDAQMGVHRMAGIVGLHLKRDLHRLVDTILTTLLDLGSTVVRPNNMTTDDTPASADSYNMDYDTINRAERTLDEQNIPTFADGFRGFVCTPKQLSNLKDDPQFARYATFFKEMNALYPGYITSINKFHVFKSNTLSIVNNTNTIPVHRAHAFGPGVLAAAMGRRPQVRPSTDDNYGETAKVIWLMDSDWVLADDRFVVSVRTT